MERQVIRNFRFFYEEKAFLEEDRIFNGPLKYRKTFLSSILEFLVWPENATDLVRQEKSCLKCKIDRGAPTVRFFIYFDQGEWTERNHSTLRKFSHSDKFAAKTFLNWESEKSLMISKKGSMQRLQFTFSRPRRFNVDIFLELFTDLGE